MAVGDFLTGVAKGAERRLRSAGSNIFGGRSRQPDEMSDEEFHKFLIQRGYTDQEAKLATTDRSQASEFEDLISAGLTRSQARHLQAAKTIRRAGAPGVDGDLLSRTRRDYTHFEATQGDRRGPYSHEYGGYDQINVPKDATGFIEDRDKGLTPGGGRYGAANVPVRKTSFEMDPRLKEGLGATPARRRGPRLDVSDEPFQDPIEEGDIPPGYGELKLDLKADAPDIDTSEFDAASEKFQRGFMGTRPPAEPGSGGFIGEGVSATLPVDRTGAEVDTPSLQAVFSSGDGSAAAPRQRVPRDHVWPSVEPSPTSDYDGLSINVPSNTLGARNNNPGNLKWANQPGGEEGEGGFARFKTMDEGFAQLQRQIELDAERGDTLSEFIYEYAPPQDNNDTESYLADLIQATGATADTSLKDIDRNRLAEAVARRETGTTLEPSPEPVDLGKEYAEKKARGEEVTAAEVQAMENARLKFGGGDEWAGAEVFSERFPVDRTPQSVVRDDEEAASAALEGRKPRVSRPTVPIPEDDYRAHADLGIDEPPIADGGDLDSGEIPEPPSEVRPAAGDPSRAKATDEATDAEAREKEREEQPWAAANPTVKDAVITDAKNRGIYSVSVGGAKGLLIENAIANGMSEKKAQKRFGRMAPKIAQITANKVFFGEEAYGKASEGVTDPERLPEQVRTQLGLTSPEQELETPPARVSTPNLDVRQKWRDQVAEGGKESVSELQAGQVLVDNMIGNGSSKKDARAHVEQLKGLRGAENLKDRANMLLGLDPDAENYEAITTPPEDEGVPPMPSTGQRDVDGTSEDEGPPPMPATQFIPGGHPDRLGQVKWRDEVYEGEGYGKAPDWINNPLSHEDAVEGSMTGSGASDPRPKGKRNLWLARREARMRALSAVAHQVGVPYFGGKASIRGSTTEFWTNKKTGVVHAIVNVPKEGVTAPKYNGEKNGQRNGQVNGQKNGQVNGQVKSRVYEGEGYGKAPDWINNPPSVEGSMTAAGASAPGLSMHASRQQAEIRARGALARQMGGKATIRGSYVAKYWTNPKTGVTHALMHVPKEGVTAGEKNGQKNGQKKNGR